MGSGDMPELGSKISLISKADIRYEGKLYTVDPQDCTIALANVRSFGTEDRKTAHPVPAQNQVYDYILFRATDIKDISVVPPTQLLCDPAIVQLSSSITSRGYGGSSGGSGGGSDYPPAPGGGGGGGGMLGGLHYSGGGSQSAGGGGGGGFNPMQSGLHGLAPRPPLHHQPPSSEFNQQPPHQQRTLSTSESVLDFLTGGGSRSSTPGSGLRKPSPTVDQGTQANPRQSGAGGSNKEHRNSQMGGGNRYQDNRDNLQLQQQGGRRMNNQQLQAQQRTRTYQQMQHHQNQNRGWQPMNNQHLGGGMNNRQPGHQQNQQQHHLNQQQNQMLPGQQQHGGQQQRQNNNRRQNNSGGRQFARAPGPRPKQPTQPLKFESDYDFDKANSEFEELKSELSKLKINGEANGPVPLMNGDVEKTGGGAPGEEGSGGPGEGAGAAGAGGGTPGQGLDPTSGGGGEGEGEDGFFYNKSKSFFDNISCEAIERSKGRSQRTDWRKERMLNSETFGVASARRNNYNRGRSGYYYNNRNGMYYQRGFQRHHQGQGGGQQLGQPQGQRYRTAPAGKSVTQPQPQAATA